MIGIRVKFFTVLLCWFGLVGVPVAAAEVVQEFTAEYTLQADGRVLVSEEIIYDFQASERHGIFRTLSKQHPQGASAWYKERFLDIAVQSVERNGEVTPYEVTDGRSEIKVRVGDPDRTITGEHRYTIQYTVDGALSTTDRGQEFYWNVTGSEWSVPLARVQARVVAAKAELLADDYACYQGRSGTNQECDSATTTAGAARQFTATNVQPGEELTIAVAVTDAVTPRSTERWSMVWLLLAGLAVWVVGLGVWVWRYRTQDDPDHPIVPQYEPYDDYLPMYTGLLFNGRLDARDIAAGILYLAEQGFLQIERTENKVWWLFSTTDYELTLQRPITDAPTRFLRTVATLLFTESATVPQTKRLSELEKYKSKNRKIIVNLQKELQKDLQDAGFMVRTVTVKEIGWAFVPGIILAILAWWWQWEVVAMVVGVAVVVVLVLVLQPRRTARGYDALLHIKGFREFLRLTDSERFTFHNAPAKNPQTFMEYLPYAIALGVEKEWAEVFADVTIPQPEWYSDTTQRSFSAVALTNDLSSFSSALASSSATSGSSGGGSAGGGAGGGGGGSW